MLAHVINLHLSILQRVAFDYTFGQGLIILTTQPSLWEITGAKNLYGPHREYQGHSLKESRVLGEHHVDYRLGMG